MNEVNAFQQSLEILWGYPITFGVIVIFYLLVKVMGLIKTKE